MNKLGIIIIILFVAYIIWHLGRWYGVMETQKYCYQPVLNDLLINDEVGDQTI